MERTPPCPHYSHCGGCSLQHLSPDAYRKRKTDIAHKTLEKLGYDSHILSELFLSGDFVRRRTKLSVRKHKKEITLGYTMKHSHEVVDVRECIVLEPRLAALIAPLRTLITSLKKSGAISDVHLTLMQDDIDISFIIKDSLTQSDKEKITLFGKNHDIARITASHDGKTYSSLHRSIEPTVRFGNIDVSLTPNSFLQATEKSEKYMTSLVLEHLKDYKKVADFYAGSGTYSFPLAEAGHRVHAYEGFADAVTTLHNAIRQNDLNTKMEATTRDLFKQPLTSDECSHYDGVVINPPRNGALSQAQQIAASTAQKIVMVSCNPHTFTRDARALHDGGYTLTRLTPIDQFTYSHHLELVGFFER